MTATPRLVRLPDQFRPARDRPTAATPTCCCCCCCCLATTISAAAVLPMRVELLDLTKPSSGAPAGRRRLAAAKFFAAVAPLAAVAGLFLGGKIEADLTDRVRVGSLVLGYCSVLMVLTAVAYSYVDKTWHALPTTAFISVCFVVELAIGVVLVLFTAGIGYIALASLVSWAVISSYAKRLARARSGPLPPRAPPGHPRPGPPAAPPMIQPPPMPRPPSSEG